MHRPLVAFIALFSTIAAFGQTQEPATAKALAAHDRGSDRAFEEVIKSSDDVLWYFEIGDVATIDKVYYTSKPARTTNPTGQGAGNPTIIPAYVFTPKSRHARLR